jgi:hypothetical protein
MTTKEAKKIVKNLGKFAGVNEISDADKMNFVFLVSLVKSRNVSIENSFIKFRWSVLVTVNDGSNLDEK